MVNTEFKRDGNNLILGKSDCPSCCLMSTEKPGFTKKFSFKICEKCKGSGKRGNGKCRNCSDDYHESQRTTYNDKWELVPSNRHYPPKGYVWDYSNFEWIQCESCQGAGKGSKEGDISDYLPAEIMATFDVKVYGTGTREASWNEQHLGHGCLYSTSGLSWKFTTVEAELNNVKQRILNGTQACKVAEQLLDESGKRLPVARLADHIGVFLNDQGYSVRAVWNSPLETATDIANEASPAEAYANYARLKKEFPFI